MTWKVNHNESAEFASLAQLALRENDLVKARELYLRAAEKEIVAFDSVNPQKQRTLGVTLVSAVSLFYKAHEFEKAENLAFFHIANTSLPLFAKDQLRDLIQTIWNEKEFEKTNVEFTKGEVLVSVSGGDVVTGGAPLELILTKVNDISRFFYRTIELMLDRPLRTRGNPERYIQEQCRPWLFQAPAGSYQFAVRVQRPAQAGLFEDDIPKVEHITKKFIEIVDASSREDQTELERIVPNEDYRKTFLKMTRNLAPTGKTYGQLAIKPTGNSDMDTVILVPDSRKVINNLIKKPPQGTERVSESGEDVQLIGTLRGLHLDKDWIEVTVLIADKEDHIKINKTGEVIDDIVGPMVNRRVIVDALRTSKGNYSFKDIQIDE